MRQRRALDDIILDVEIAAIHVHPRVALADEQARGVAAVAEDQPVVENEVEAVRGGLDLHDKSQF